MKVCIIIPAHNEEDRIERTLRAYAEYFKHKEYRVNFLVVLNACTDRTLAIVQEVQKGWDSISFINLNKGGKGFAIKQGFGAALKGDYEYIGFVDADMATSPAEYEKLIKALPTADGIIASRYMPGAIVTPPRPWIKRWGSKLVYEPFVRFLFGIKYYDYQCGAKIFYRKVIQVIQPELRIMHWAFDVELLYLCKRHKFIIKEIPTEWHDQANSKLHAIGAGFKMLITLLWLRLYYVFHA